MKRISKAQEGEGETANVRASRGPRRTKRTQRDYENEFAAALEALGYIVVDAPVYRALIKKSKGKPLGDIVVRQFTPGAPDPRTQQRGAWRLDFAVPSLRVYVELDGFGGGGRSHLGGHRTWSGFHRDRLKDRAMTFQQWRGLRYGPADMTDQTNMLACASEFVLLVEMAAERALQ